jgi:hypothetical protein
MISFRLESAVLMPVFPARKRPVLRICQLFRRDEVVVAVLPYTEEIGGGISTGEVGVPYPESMDFAGLFSVAVPWLLMLQVANGAL